MRIYIENWDENFYLFILQSRQMYDKRIFVSENEYARDFNTLYPKALLSFIIFEENDQHKLDVITTKYNEKQDSYLNLRYSMQTAIKAFLESGKEWLIRTTDDCFVDLRVIGKYIHRLNAQYNTYEEDVIKGMIINANKPNTFIHGGSGWIMSHSLARKIYEDYILMNEITLSQVLLPDDKVPNLWIKKYGLNESSIYDTAFFGPPLENHIEMELVSDFNREINNISLCNKSKYSIIHPIDEIILWHSGRPSNLFSAYGYQIKDKYRGKGIQLAYKDAWTLCLDNSVKTQASTF